jgi:hypothetical protein
MRLAIWVMVLILAVESLAFGNAPALMAGLILAVVGILCERKDA